MESDAARHTGKAAQIVCLTPDVCLTPCGSSMVPVPYMIVSKMSWAVRTEPKVTFGEEEAFTMNSRTNRVTGNEAGTGGGVQSGVNVGWCRPRSNKSSFYIRGYEVIQHDNIYEMNCNGPEGPHNTLGKLFFIDKF